jgi:hypothetical protein
MSKRISCEELVSTGFVNKVITPEFTGNALAHNERFIRLSDAKTLDEGTTSAAFSNETPAPSTTTPKSSLSH